MTPRLNTGHELNRSLPYKGVSSVLAIQVPGHRWWNASALSCTSATQWCHVYKEGGPVTGILILQNCGHPLLFLGVLLALAMNILERLKLTWRSFWVLEELP